MEEKDFFEELKSGVTYAAESIGNVGRNVYRKSRLAIEEADIRRELRDTLARLGRVYFELRTSGSDDLSVADELVEAVEKLDEKLFQVTAEKSDAKQEVVCPICGRKNAKDASFCSGCGVAL